MLKRICAHKLLLILVIALIARPAMSVMLHDATMATGTTDSAVHCHDYQSEECPMSMNGDHHQASCDQCADSCAFSVVMFTKSNEPVALAHPQDSSISPFILSRRNDETFRPPIYS